MAPTRFHWIDDDGSGSVGTVINDAELQKVLQYTDDAAAALAVGAWVTVPFNVANFWPGVTAGQVPINQKCVIGKTLFWICQIVNAPAPAGNPAQLELVLPVSPAQQALFGAGLASDGGATLAAVAYLYTPSAIGVIKNAGGTWNGPTVSLYFTGIVALT